MDLNEVLVPKSGALDSKPEFEQSTILLFFLKRLHVPLKLNVLPDECCSPVKRLGKRPEKEVI